MTGEAWAERARRILPGCRFRERMCHHTTFAIGGPVTLWARVGSIGEATAALRLAGGAGMPWMVLGGGSNVLVSDGGWRGCVFRLAGALAEVAVDGDRIVAGAGASLADVCRKAADAGLSGMEELSHIPGTVGGAVAGNAGAWGRCIADVLESVTVLSSDGVRELSGAEAGMGYRTSALGGVMILRASLRLAGDDPGAIRERMAEYGAARMASQPVGRPGAGCIFRNPEGLSAGRLLDEAGCKGMRSGGAAVSDLHANFIVNTSGAASSDVLALMTEMADAVWRRFHIALEPEIVLIGDSWSAHAPAGAIEAGQVVGLG